MFNAASPSGGASFQCVPSANSDVTRIPGLEPGPVPTQHEAVDRPRTAPPALPGMQGLGKMPPDHKFGLNPRPNHGTLLFMVKIAVNIATSAYHPGSM